MPHPDSTPQVKMSSWSAGLYQSRHGKMFHRRRLERCLDACRTLSGSSVLEVGCHDMLFYQMLGLQFDRFVGVDNLVYGEHLDELRRDSAWRNVSVLSCGAESLPFESESFDLVLSFETLEHVEDEDAATAEIARVIRPGGTLLFSVPIEIGLLLPLKVVTRRLLRGTREYRLAELFHAALRCDVSKVRRDQHKGYDYRQTVRRFGRHGLALQHVRRLPVRWLPGWMNLGAIVQMVRPEQAALGQSSDVDAARRAA